MAILPGMHDLHDDDHHHQVKQFPAGGIIQSFVETMQKELADQGHPTLIVGGGRLGRHWVSFDYGLGLHPLANHPDAIPYPDNLRAEALAEAFGQVQTTNHRRGLWEQPSAEDRERLLGGRWVSEEHTDELRPDTGDTFAELFKKFMTERTAPPPERPTIAQIHEAFDFDLLSLFGGMADDEQLRQWVPSGMDFDTFKALVQDYRQRYPLNNYIPEARLKELCVKYGLVVGPGWAFTEPIPEQNQRDIAAFHLQRQDATTTSAFALPVVTSKRGEVVLTSAWVRASEDDNTVAFYPVNDRLAFMVGGSADRSFVHLWGQFHVGDTVVHGQIPLTRANTIGAPVFESRSTMTRGLQVRLRLTVKASLFTTPMRQLSLDSEVSPLVVAPPHAFMNGLQLRDGYRLVLPSENVGEVRAVDLAHQFRGGGVTARTEVLRRDVQTTIDRTKEQARQRQDTIDRAARQLAEFRERMEWLRDPVVGQPMPGGGILVVTKWGDEAQHPEFQNGVEN